MRATALLLLSSVAILGVAITPASAQTRLAGAADDKSRQIVVEEKEGKAKEEAAPAEVEEEAKEEPAKAQVKEEVVKEEAKDEPKAEVKEEVIIKEVVKEDPGVEVKEEVIIKEVVKEEPPLVVVLQTELKRVGCYHGVIDGTWGPQSSEALADFYHYAKFSNPHFEPTPDALALVKGKKGVVCIAHERPQDDYGGYDRDGGYGGHDGGGYDGGGGYSDGY